ncbi:glycosyltransferase family 2 protein [Bacillus sp. 1P02SD]|uniref:glycosyltransferase family 2 protein n=1 Tax=Bacillus sp. 1P02SD TaxID=3132264 RepID=UPI0039A32B34
MESPLVSIVILNFNSDQKTKICIESITKLRYEPLEIIIVDNSTNSESAKKVEEISREHSFIFKRIHENMGYAAGNRVGVEIALGLNSDYVFILNNDTYLEENCITNIIEVMEQDKSICVAGPVIYDLVYGSDRTIKLTENLQSAGLKISSLSGVTTSDIHFDSSRFSEHPFISGAALMLRADIIKKHGFIDESFFLYFEETDYCFTLRDHDPLNKIVTVNDSKIWHETSSDIEEKIYSLYYSHRNKIVFMKKHFRGKFFFFLLYLFLLSIPKKMLKILKDNKKGYTKTLFKATVDGLRGRLGKSDF